MADQIEQVIRDKVLTAVEALPAFLHQIRRDLIECGRSPHRLVYFNFEDERLGGLEAGRLHLIPEAQARLFPASSDEPVVLFLDENGESVRAV